MSSLVLLPSSSLLPSLPYSVHGAAAALPTSPNSSWSPSASPQSPQSRMNSLCLATSASSLSSPVSAYTLPPHSRSHPAATSSAVVAHVLSLPASRVQSVAAPAAATATATTSAGHSPYSHHSLTIAAATPSFLSASSPAMSPPPAMLTPAALTSHQPAASQSLVPSTLQSGQTIVFDQNGQAFILSPITSVAPNYQPQTQPTINQQSTVHMQQYAPAHYPVPSFSSSIRQGSQRNVALGSAVSTQSNTIVLSQQPPLYQHSWTGGDTLSLATAPFSVGQQLYANQLNTANLTVPMGSTVHHSHAQPLLLTTGPALLHGSSPVPTISSFGSPTGSPLSAGLSPVPVISSAFQPLTKRALSANVSPSLIPSLRPLSPAVATLLHTGMPASPHPTVASASGSRTPQRKMSAASSSTQSNRPSEETDNGDAAALLYSVPVMARNSSDSGGEQSTSPRIDGLSSSRLLTHVNKKPSHVLPFVIHRSQLPHNFDHLVNSAAHSNTQPSTPTHQPSTPPTATDMVTVNIRVMGGPALTDLYFVAADISQLIHSRKSNIAKAVSVFTDDERARCSVVCPRSNNTQSTHILTVLTMAGVKRLLHSSRATIALPLLAWLQDKVDQIVAQDNSSRSQSHTEQQRTAVVTTGKRKSGISSSSGSSSSSSSGGGGGGGGGGEQRGRPRHEDVKEDEVSSDKRTKRQ